MDAVDSDARAHVGAAFRGVVEEERVELGSDDVPGVVGLAERDEVGVLERSSKKRELSGLVEKLEREAKKREKRTSFAHILIKLDRRAGLICKEGLC